MGRCRHVLGMQKNCLPQKVMRWAIATSSSTGDTGDMGDTGQAERSAHQTMVSGG